MRKFFAALAGAILCMMTGCGNENTEKCLFPREENAYVGDVMALSEDGGVYLNYLYETDHNGVGYHPIHSFFTRDFLSFEERGEVLAFAEDSEKQDLAVGTGSFIKDDQGRYHCFYTGHNDYYDTYGLDKECVMHAVSKDNKTYTKNYEDIIHAPSGYSTVDFRDPQIVKRPDGYIMLVGARKEAEDTSAVIWYESQDLYSWVFKGDFYTSDELYFMECPDVFELGGKYYMVFCWNNVVYYRIADSFWGPWEKPEIDTFDGNGFYAAKTCEYEGKRYLIGFLDRKKRENDSLMYTWAGNVLIYELRQLPDGTLGVCMPEKYNDYFDKEILPCTAVGEGLDKDGLTSEVPDGGAGKERQTSVADSGEDGNGGQTSATKDGGAGKEDQTSAAEIGAAGNGDQTSAAESGELDFGKVPETCHLSLDLSMKDEGVMNLWFTNAETDEEYRISIDNKKDLIEYNAFPNCQPMKLESGKAVKVDVVVEKDIVVVYVDGIKALSNRVYCAVGGSYRLEVKDAAAENVRICGR